MYGDMKGPNGLPPLGSVLSAITVLWWTSSALTSLLFVCRVRAIFKHSPTAKLVFSALWVLIGLAPGPMLWSGIGPPCHGDAQITFEDCPNYCSFALVLLVIIGCHETLGFVGVSRELVDNAYTTSHSLRTLLTGKGLHPVSKSLLQTGQLYYA